MGPFAFNFDFKGRYHHLDICPHHRQVYRGCSLMVENVSSCLMFFCSVYFTKNLRPLVKYLGS